MTDNDKRRFAAAMDALYKVFNKEADPAITKVLFASLQHLDIEGAEYCISQAIMKEPRFPVPKELLKYQHELPRKNIPSIPYKAEYNQNLADLSMKLINGLLDGKLTNRQYVEGMQAMNKQFPGIGWDEEAVKLVRHLQGEGINV